MASDNQDRRDEVLQMVNRKRGYTLPYHELFAGMNPELLMRYDSFYDALTLQQNTLSDREKELVWIAILAIADEEAGSIHLKRAEKAGVALDETVESLTIAQMVRGQTIWTFVAQYWQEDLPQLNVWQAYDCAVGTLFSSGPIDPELVELIFIGAATAAANKQLLEHHFLRAEKLGIDERKIAEAMSFIFIPRGGNQLLDMAQVIKNTVQSKKVEPTSVFKVWERNSVES